jgi:hypothetical protein
VDYEAGTGTRNPVYGQLMPRMTRERLVRELRFEYLEREEAADSYESVKCRYENPKTYRLFSLVFESCWLFLSGGMAIFSGGARRY